MFSTNKKTVYQLLEKSDYEAHNEYTLYLIYQK